MVADLREMQENQWVSEIRIDKLEFVCEITAALTWLSLRESWRELASV